jgi:hypothetical protein
MIAKFLGDGTLDTTFGASSGYTDTVMSGTGAYALARQADGKFIAAGQSSGTFGIARFTAGGILDTTFNSTGKVTASFASVSGDLVYGLAVGPDYKITAAGYTDAGGVNGKNFALARIKVTSGLEQRIYAETDANHNVTSLSNVFGTVLQREVYDPYGSVTTLNASWGTTSDAYSWVTLFQGKRFDATTGL